MGLCIGLRIGEVLLPADLGWGRPVILVKRFRIRRMRFKTHLKCDFRDTPVTLLKVMHRPFYADPANVASWSLTHKSGEDAMKVKRGETRFFGYIFQLDVLV